jgi:UDP-N-acetylmuramyl pentapeptide phosphotransferase/UDP-N-acetylglucosamine-1-phosphate transferase
MTAVGASAAAAVLAGAGVSAALAGLVAWSGPVDPPRARGSHRRPTPTSGGLGILAGASVAAALGAALGPATARRDLWPVAVTVATAGALGLLGALDDVVDLGAKAKLLLQMAVALVFALVVARVEHLPLAGGFSLPLGPWVGAAGAALWIVVATNAVNFMDGANGVAGGALAVALAALAAGAFTAGEPAVGLAALAGAAANGGYLPWNLRGGLFQGDAGALFSGFLFAALSVVAERSGTGLYVYFGPLALLPFLTDVLLTLLYRARRGRSLLEAHRDHLYQLWLQRTGRTHAALAWRVGVIMAAYGLYALLVQRAAPGARLALFGVGLAICVGGWTGLRRGLERA